MKYLVIAIETLVGIAIAAALAIQLHYFAPLPSKAPENWTSEDRHLVEVRTPGGFWRNDQRWLCFPNDKNQDVWLIFHSTHNLDVTASACWR